MFIGHFAVGLAAKKAVPKTSLGTLFLAAQFVDLLWPLFLLFGIEHVKIEIGNTPVTPLNFYDYPLTHSLVMAIFWSILIGGIYYAIKKYLRGAVVISAVLFSHWLLDLVSHRPDLPLAPGLNIFFGLGLWYSPAATFIVELILFVIGITLYLQTTTASDKIGIAAFWSLIGLLVISWIGNLMGGPPPNVETIAIVGNAMWLFVLLAYWADKHRKSIES